MRKLNSLLTAFLTFAAFAYTVAPSSADTVILKSGEKIEGTITYESNILVKVAVKISNSINETKTIARNDIGEIIKVAPDAVAFNEIQNSVPTPSLMSPADYTALLEKGPATFKTEFPNSQFLSQVTEVEATLLEELDKAERGFKKIDGKWVTPQELRAKEMLMDSRIRKHRYDFFYGEENFVSALREFDLIENSAYGTPAHAAILKTIPDLLRAYGSFLTNNYNKVDYLLAQEATDLERLDITQRNQIQQARANEIQRYAAFVKKEKEAGIKWLTIDTKSKPQLQAGIKLVKSEAERISKINTTALESLSGSLEKIDSQIFDGELQAAEEALEEIKDGGTGSKKSSYFAHLINSLEEAKLAKEEARKQAIADEKVKGMVDDMLGKKNALVREPVEETEAEAEASGNLAAAMAAKKKASKEAAAKRAAEEEAAALAAKAKKEKAERAKEEKAAKKPTKPSSDGGGIGFGAIIRILGILFVIGAVVWKYVFKGGKK